MNSKELAATVGDEAACNLLKLEAQRQNLYLHNWFVKEALVTKIGVVEDDGEISYYYTFPKANVEEYEVKDKEELKRLKDKAVNDLKKMGVQVDEKV